MIEINDEQLSSLYHEINSFGICIHCREINHLMPKGNGILDGKLCAILLKNYLDDEKDKSKSVTKHHKEISL
jgi:hypothetical protein